MTPSELGLELSGPLQDQGWYILVTNSPAETSQDVVDILDALGLENEEVEANVPGDVPTKSTAAVCVVVQNWSSDACYAELDYLRARILAAWPLLIWIANYVQAQELARLAPNFSSFFANSREWGMTKEERESQLAALRATWEQTDQEIIELATSGLLQQDADHHFWLVLLGRTDLIGAKGREDE